MSLHRLALIGIALLTMQTAHAATTHAWKRHIAHRHAIVVADAAPSRQAIRAMRRSKGPMASACRQASCG